jgi:outer membrane lipoprotein carrier protein
MRLFLMAVLVTTSFAATAAEIDNAAAALAGTQAQFTQRFTPKGFKNSQVESGTVIFGALPMMRWSYSRPEEKIFVFDGGRSWFYIPADRQVTVSDLDDRKRSELPFLMLGDQAARERNFTVQERPRGTSVVTTLQPRNAGALIRNVTITTSASTHMIQRVEYTDREGNHTAFDFSGYQRRPATAEQFRFTPPPGVQVVQGQ